MATKVEQLLTVWNPYYQPETIQVHVELLRRHEKVWWGRLYRGRRLNEAAAQKKFAQTFRVAQEAAEAGRDLVLFATNHVLLHALLVDEVRFGWELPEEERPFAPKYYWEQEAHPAVWFRVRDARALAFRQIDTLRFFFDSGELEAGLIGFDPFAAYKWEYPIVVRGPSAEETFDKAHLRGRARFFADHPETLFPPEVELARRELQKVLGSLWQRLEEKSQQFLASGWLVYGRYQGHRDFDLSSAFSGVARAVETELCEATVAPLVDHLGLRATFFRDKQLTLGRVNRSLDGLAKMAREVAPKFASLASDREWRSWLGSFVTLRNDAAHPKQVRKSRIARAWEEVVSQDSRLALLVRAKQEVARLCRTEKAAFR